MAKGTCHSFPNRTLLAMMLVVTLLFITLLLLRSYRVTEAFCDSDADKDKHRLLFFSMAECRYCIEFEPLWRKLADDPGLQRLVCFQKIGSDQPRFQELTRRHSVVSYPTLVIEPPATTGRGTKFTGQRTEAALRHWISTQTGGGGR
jgi:hypothetical protein